MPRRFTTFLAACAIGLMALAGGGARAVDDNYFVMDDLTFGNTTIGFDTDAAGNPLDAPKLFEEAAPLREQYAALGVHFGSAQGGAGGCILHQDSTFGLSARSGTNFLAFNREAETAQGGAPREPEVISFDQTQPAVSVYAAGGFASESFRMDAYDATGKLVDTNSAAASQFQQLSVASPAGIARIVLSRNGPRSHTTLSVPDLTGAPGADVTIPIQVDANAQAVAAAQLSLQYEDVIAVTDPAQITAGPLLANGLVETDLSTSGIARVSAASGQGTDGPGAVLLIQAKIRADAPPGKYPLHLSDVQLSDTLGGPILTDLVDGSITVQPSAPPAAQVAVSVPDVTGSPGAAVTIPIQVDANAQALAGVLVTLQYPDLFGLTDASQVTAGPLMPAGLVSADLAAPGAATVSIVTTKGANGPGAVMLIQGTIRADAAPGQYPLHLSGVQLSDVHGTSIPATTVDGSLIVQAPALAVLCGDFDGNGSLSIADVVTALQIAVGLQAPTDAQTQAACSRSISVGYVVQLLRVAVGLDDSSVLKPMGGG